MTALSITGGSTGDLTIKGNWVVYEGGIISADGGGPAAGMAPEDPGNPYPEGENVTVLGNTGGLSRPGYRFAGWTPAPDGTGPVYQAGDVFRMPAETVTLCAGWEAAVPLAWSAAYEGGAAQGTPPEDPCGPYVEGASVAVQDQAALSREGFRFMGWTPDPGGSGPVYQPGDIFTMPGRDVTLYALWELIPGRFSVMYDGSGAACGRVPADSRFYAEGETASVLGSADLARKGYRFAGWAVSPAGGAVYQPGDSFPMPGRSVTFYALWEPLGPGYTAAYDGNCACRGWAPADPKVYRAGDTVTVLGNMGGLTKCGCRFAGWIVSPGGAVYRPGTTFQMPARDVVFYALWESAAPRRR